MSKIGRKPIDIAGVQVTINGQDVQFKGPKSAGTYHLPNELKATLADNKLTLTPAQGITLARRDLNRIWGLHRALLANNIKGASGEFEKKLEIIGLGFKAVLANKKLVFTLGYTHKIEFDVPKEVTVEIDKTGQKLTIKSSNKELVGQICSNIRAMRLPEPYKGTGVKLATEVIQRKAGKAKAAAA